MAWDLALDPRTHDLTGGIVSGADEIMQRLKVRLWRHLDEWFLNRKAGLPWYDASRPGGSGSGTTGSSGSARRGMLGSRDIQAVELLIRRETLETKGVTRVLSLQAAFIGREFSLRMEVLVEGGSTQSLTLERIVWQE